MANQTQPSSLCLGGGQLNTFALMIKTPLFQTDLSSLEKAFLVIRGRGVVWVESRSLGTLSGAMRQAGGSSKELLCRALSWEQSK